MLYLLPFYFLENSLTDEQISSKNQNFIYFCFLYYISQIYKPFFTNATTFNHIN